MELVVKDNISNNISNKIIKFFNKYSNLKESLLLKLTKSGKDYINQISLLLVDFKEKIVTIYSEVDIKLYYHSIFQAIQIFL